MAPPVSQGRRTASTALLVVGYPLSIVAGYHPLTTYRERRVERFLAMEAGIACVTAGLVLRRRPLPALVNAVTLVGLAGAWVATGRWLR